MPNKKSIPGGRFIAHEGRGADLQMRRFILDPALEASVGEDLAASLDDADACRAMEIAAATTIESLRRGHIARTWRARQE